MMGQFEAAKVRRREQMHRRKRYPAMREERRDWIDRERMRKVFVHVKLEAKMRKYSINYFDFFERKESGNECTF